MHKPKHIAEAVAFHILFAAFRILPLDVASWLGGFLARHIGPHLRAQRIAQENLQTVMPHFSAPERAKILNGMWDNLGRVAAELPHLGGKKIFERLKIHGFENLPTDTPALFFSGHYGNWELLPAIACMRGLPVSFAYREANNKLVDKAIAKLRAAQVDNMFAKGPKGAFKLARAVKKEMSIAMLVDQKMNEGIAVPFFGRDAMTAPALAQLALRHDIKILPSYIMRTKGAHFESLIMPPLEYRKTGDEKADALSIMTQVNALLESWIRERPEQWFWVHRRWPSA